MLELVNAKIEELEKEIEKSKAKLIKELKGYTDEESILTLSNTLALEYAKLELLYELQTEIEG